MKKGFITSLILILVIAALVVGAFYVGKNYSSPTTSLPSSSPTVTAADETASWKTYKDPKGRYSFKFSSLWDSPKTDKDEVTLVAFEKVRDVFGGIPVYFHVNYWNNPKKQSFNVFFQQIHQGWPEDLKSVSDEVTKTKIGEYTVFVTNLFPGTLQMRYFFTDDDSRFVEFRITDLDSSEVYNKLLADFQRTLSTFKFTQ